jgi:hypothetical protein
MEERPTSPPTPPFSLSLSLPSPNFAGLAFPLPPPPFERAVSLLNYPLQIPEYDLCHYPSRVQLPVSPLPLPTSPLPLPIVSTSTPVTTRFTIGDVVQVFNGTGSNVRASRTVAYVGRIVGYNKNIMKWEVHHYP